METTVDDFIDFAKRLKSWRMPSIAVVASESTLGEMEREIHVVKVQ